MSAPLFRWVLNLNALLALLLFTQPAAAEVIPKLGEYENVEVTKVEPDGLRITHKHGVAKVRFETLPPELQQKYGFSTDKAKEFRSQVESQQKDRAKMEKIVSLLHGANLGMSAKVLQVLPNGVLISGITIISGKKVAVQEREVAGTKLGTNNALNNSRVPEYVYKTKWVRPAAFEDGPYFVSCDPSGIAEGASFRRIVFPAGTFSYTNGLQQPTTVAKWTVYPNTFSEAEGLGPVPDSALAEIEVKYPGFPAIPREAAAPSTSQATGGSGSGVVVGDGTLIATCAHVVKGMTKIEAVNNGVTYECEVVSTDEKADVAILKLKSGRLKPATINALGPEIGENVFTLGFPNPELQGSEVKLTDGRISSLSGIQDDRLWMQITVPVQPGNSGGGLFNEQGEVVGVVAAKLSLQAGLKSSGALPENVNYAVKVDSLTRLLPASTTSANVVRTRKKAVQPMQEVVKQISGSVVQVIVRSR